MGLDMREDIELLKDERVLDPSPGGIGVPREISLTSPLMCGSRCIP